MNEYGEHGDAGIHERVDNSVMVITMETDGTALVIHAVVDMDWLETQDTATRTSVAHQVRQSADFIADKIAAGAGPDVEITS